MNSQFIKFLSGGFLAVLLDWITFFGLTELLQVQSNVAKAISYLVGTVFAFYFNGILTFKSELNLSRFRRHLTLYGLSFILNITTYSLVENRYSLGFLPTNFMALIMATSISTIVNYLGMRFWVFNTGTVQIEKR
jgi:putative flippase GtrA